MTMNRIGAGFLSFTIVLGLVFGAFPKYSYAATPLNVLIYTHTNDPVVGSAYLNSYNAFRNIPNVTVTTRDITGWSFNQYQSQLRTDMVSGDNLLIYGGHGSLTDLSTDGVSFTRDYAMRAASNIAAEKGGTVTGVVESCGSGNVCRVSNLAGDGSLEGVYTAANPGDYGWVSSSGGPWYANFGEKFKSVLSEFGTGSSLDPDVNGDGVLTHGELADALYGKNKGNRSQIPDPDKAFAYKDQATADKYAKYTECIILRPGQVDNSYSGSAGSSSDASVEFKPGSVSGYGNRTQDPATFPVLGQVRDTVTTQESELNFNLRKLGSDFIEKHVQKELNSPSKAQGIKKKIVILPTASQAQEFIGSLGGNAGGQGSYTVNGMKVRAGKHYLTNSPDPEDKIKFDNDCNPTSWNPPSPEPATPPAGNNSGGNQGGNGGQASTPNSGLESLLPLLMQSLLGGGRPQGGNNSGYGNNGGAQQSCATQGVFPVCGSDGMTYTNSCYLQQYGVVQVNTGVCASSQATPTPNIATLAAQLIASGVPQSVINSIIASLSSLFNNPNGQTVIR